MKDSASTGRFELLTGSKQPLNEETGSRIVMRIYAGATFWKALFSP